MQRRLNTKARALRSWNQNHFGYAHEKIKILERELEILQFNEGENLDR